MIYGWPRSLGRITIICEGWLALKVGVTSVGIVCMKRGWLVGGSIGVGSQVMIAAVQLALRKAKMLVLKNRRASREGRSQRQDATSVTKRKAIPPSYIWRQFSN